MIHVNFNFLIVGFSVLGDMDTFSSIDIEVE